MSIIIDIFSIWEMNESDTLTKCLVGRYLIYRFRKVRFQRITYFVQSEILYEKGKF